MPKIKVRVRNYNHFVIRNERNMWRNYGTYEQYLYEFGNFSYTKPIHFRIRNHFTFVYENVLLLYTKITAIHNGFKMKRLELAPKMVWGIRKKG